MIDIFTLVSKNRQDLLKEHNTHFSQSLHTKKQFQQYVERVIKQTEQPKGTND